MSVDRESGACFCGMIAAEFSGQPFWTCYDHDDDCRRAVGSPLNIWIGFRQSQIHFSRGTPKAFSKTPGVRRTFCSDCGTSIGYHDEGLSDEFYIAIGFVDHPERFQPQAHAYWSMNLPRVNLPDDLPRIDEVTRVRDPAFGNPASRRT